MRPGPGLRFVSVYMRTVRTQTGTKLTRLGRWTETKSDRSEFVSRPVSCKRKQRNVWRPIRTHAGVLADLDPPKFGPPGPNSLADLDPPVQIR